MPPGKPAARAQALAFMLDDPEAAARTAQAARTRIGGDFHPDVHGRELAEAYRVAMRDGAARTGTGPAVRGL